jgi:hypothetical protein
VTTPFVHILRLAGLACRRLEPDKRVHLRPWIIYGRNEAVSSAVLKDLFGLPLPVFATIL